MTETDLSDAALAALRKRLEDRRAELMEDMRAIDDRLRERPPSDAEDRATEREEDEVLEERGMTDSRELQDVENALQRMEHGTYGVCTSCGEIISAARLDAVPEASHCVACA
jgi:RNA polymerase-binding protein DksA